ncbi:MAG: hypothetical protein IH612_08650 [Desulfofustis sp.]|nr:hypothetical protein [Desulfofustis sp.]
MMELFIGIDDTDKLDSPGSGVLADRLTQELHDNGLAQCSAITRHQLLVHERIAFTSHNSAMCFSADCQESKLAELINCAQYFLQKHADPASDPGLSVVINNCHLNREQLVSFGQRAKRYVVDKQEAYDLAKWLGVHLSEHGGDGIGVIGALAATGLRLSGSDGRYRGWHNLGHAGDSTTAGWLAGHDFIDAVVADDGTCLEASATVMFSESCLKTVLLNGNRVIPVVKEITAANKLYWKTLPREKMKRF